MSRKLRMIRRLERHLRRHPNDKMAKAILEALRSGQYEWRGKSLRVKVPIPGLTPAPTETTTIEEGKPEETNEGT